MCPDLKLHGTSLLLLLPHAVPEVGRRQPTMYKLEVSLHIQEDLQHLFSRSYAKEAWEMQWTGCVTSKPTSPGMVFGGGVIERELGPDKTLRMSDHDGIGTILKLRKDQNVPQP